MGGWAVYCLRMQLEAVRSIRADVISAWRVTERALTLVLALP